MSRDSAVVMRYDSPDHSEARDVVYLHARGSSEREAGWILPLFGNARVRAYRGPLQEGGGFAWFRSADIGYAAPDSLASETAKIADWIAADGSSRKPWLCGFSNGAAMAGNLFLTEPSRYSGLIMIGGCFANDDGLPSRRLCGMPVLFCRGLHDQVIPRAKFEEAETYLLNESGALVTVLGYEGGHELPVNHRTFVQGWLAAQAV